MQAVNKINTSTAIFEELPGPSERQSNSDSAEQRHPHDPVYPQTTGAKALWRKLVSAAISDIRQKKARMQDLLESALVEAAPGEKQHPDEQAWQVVHQFDALRLAGHDCTDMLASPVVQVIEKDPKHPSLPDAKLFMDIMARPIEGKVPLEKYLADKVESGLYLEMAISHNPESRTFNSILPGLMLSTLDYNSVGRTLMFKGATHLIGIPDDALTKEQSARKSSLQKTIFGFPKRPAEGARQLELLDFNKQPDPLEALKVYEE